MIDTIIKGAVTRKTITGSPEWIYNSMEDNTLQGFGASIQYAGLFLSDLQVPGDASTGFSSKLDVLVYNSVTDRGNLISSIVKFGEIVDPSTRISYTYNPSTLFSSNPLELDFSLNKEFNYNKLSFATENDSFLKNSMEFLYKESVETADSISTPSLPVIYEPGTHRIIRDGWYSQYAIYTSSMPSFSDTGSNTFMLNSLFTAQDDTTAWEKKDFFWLPDIHMEYTKALMTYTTRAKYASIFPKLQCKLDAIEHFIRVGKYAEAQYIVQSLKHLQFKIR